MADRLDYYFRQRVTEAELDLGFELLERADRNLAADIGVYGIVSGAEPSPHSPVADLTIDLTPPGRAYDRIGQRIFFGTGQRVDCSVDLSGLPTEVTVAGKERWLGVFLRFDRLLSDPRTDGNSQQVYFRRDETFKIVVRQGPEGNVGTAPRVLLQEDELLVCDVLRRHGQLQILAGDIDVSRRQAFIFATGDAVQIISGLWSVLSPAAATVQSALDSVDAILDGHFDGTANKHPASTIDYTPHGFVAASNVQGAIDEVVDDLSSATAGSPGASKVGADAVAGTPNALPAGNVDGQLSQLLAWINNHFGAAAGAHAASAISVADAGGNLNAGNVESALAEIADAFEGDHYRGNEGSAGQHRTIRQPNLGTGKVLLWDASGVGAAATHFRVYVDDDSLWFVVNTAWNGSEWARDSTNWYCGGFRFSRMEFELLHDDSFAATFSSWSHSWLMFFQGFPNSGFVTSGAIREVGRCGIESHNTYSSSRGMALGASVTFRSRFPATPSSITFASTSTYNFSGSPTVWDADRDGFGFYGFQIVPANMSVYWFGSYTAVA